MAFMLGSFLGGAAEGMQKNTELGMNWNFRVAELSMKALEYEKQLAELHRQTANDRIKIEGENYNAFLGTVKSALEKRGDEMMTNPQLWNALQDKLTKQAALVAGAYANAYGGDPHDHMTNVLNRMTGELAAVGTPAAVKMNESIATAAGLKAAGGLGVPQMAGQQKGQEAFSTATGGGAAATAIDTAAKESQIPRTVTPEQGIKFVPSPGIPGMPSMGNPAVTAPTQSAVSPQPPALGAGLPQGAPMGQMPGQPGGGGFAVPPTMSPATYQAETQLGKDFGEKGSEKFDKAMQSLQSLYSMNAAADKLQQTGGFATMGEGATFRQEAAKSVNSWAQTFGVSPPFDPNAIGDWEMLTKGTKLMGMQVVNTMFGGSREAASIINGATSAVPNAENTYLGFRLVSSGIEQATAREMELHSFTGQKLGQNQPIANAAVAFNQTHPVAQYVMRALSNAVPDEYVNALKQNPGSVAAFDGRFGRGIGEFILHGGRTGMGAVGGMPSGAGAGATGGIQ